MTPRELFVGTASEPPPAESTVALSDYIRGTGLRSVVLGASKDANAKITVLLVSAETGTPVLAVKAPTTEIAARAVEHEQRILGQLEHLPLGSVSETIPRVMATVEFEGRPALVTTAVPGKPLTTAYLSRRHTARHDSVSDDFAAAADWLAHFQEATSEGATTIDMDCGVVRRLRERYPASDSLERDIDRLNAIHSRLCRDDVPRTAVHGDLWFGNLLLNGGGVSGVVDWESGAVSGEPLRDLARFALAYALFLDRGTRAGRPVHGHPGLRRSHFGAGVEFAVDGSGWFPDLFRRFLCDGLARLGASTEHWRDVALAGVAEVAAFTDDDAFAANHLELFRRLAQNSQVRDR